MLFIRQFNLEPKPDAPITIEYLIHSSLVEQVRAQQANALLKDLYVAIKDRAKIPTKPAYQKLYRTWLLRPLNLRTLPTIVVDPIYYFELF